MKNEISIKLDNVLDVLLKLRTDDAASNQLLKITKKRILDTSDMLIIFQVCSRTMDRWRQKKLFNFSKISGKYYYLWDDIVPLLQSRLLIQDL